MIDDPMLEIWPRLRGEKGFPTSGAAVIISEPCRNANGPNKMVAWEADCGLNGAGG